MNASTTFFLPRKSESRTFLPFSRLLGNSKSGAISPTSGIREMSSFGQLVCKGASDAFKATSARARFQGQAARAGRAGWTHSALACFNYPRDGEREDIVGRDNHAARGRA